MQKKITFSYAETWSLGHSTREPKQPAEPKCDCGCSMFCEWPSDDTPHERLTQNGKRLTPEIERMAKLLKQGGYDLPYASINLSTDTQLRAQVKQLVNEKRSSTQLCS